MKIFSLLSILLFLTSCSGSLGGGAPLVEVADNATGGTAGGAAGGSGLGGNEITYQGGAVGDLTYHLTYRLYQNAGTMLYKFSPDQTQPLALQDGVHEMDVIPSPGGNLVSNGEHLRTSTATAKYFKVENGASYDLYYLDTNNDTWSGVLLSNVAYSDSLAVSDNSFVVYHSTSSEIYFGKSGSASANISAVFPFIANHLPLNSSYAPLGKNYFLIIHGGAGADKLLFLNGNNLTYSVVAGTSTASSPSLVDQNDTSALIEISNNDASKDYYLFKFDTQTLTKIISVDNNTSTSLTSLKDLTYLVVANNTGIGEVKIYKVNVTTATATAIVTSTTDFPRIINGSCSSSELYTNMALTMVYVICEPVVDGGGTLTDAAELYTVNMSTGAVVRYVADNNWTDDNNNFFMYQDNLYVVGDVDNDSVNEFEKITLSNNTISWAATNDIDTNFKTKICEDFGNPTPCVVTIDYSVMSAFDHHTPKMVSMADAYEWGGFIMQMPVSAGQSSVTINGTPKRIDHFVLHNGSVYISAPLDPAEGNAFTIMGSMLQGYIYFSTYFYNHVFM